MNVDYHEGFLRLETDACYCRSHSVRGFKYNHHILPPLELLPDVNGEIFAYITVYVNFEFELCHHCLKVISHYCVLE
jgi:hypothetical protein